MQLDELGPSYDAALQLTDNISAKFGLDTHQLLEYLELMLGEGRAEQAINAHPVNSAPATAPPHKRSGPRLSRLIVSIEPMESARS